MCGDFNRYDFSFLNKEFDLTNIVQVPTFRDAILDNFFCETNDADKFKAASAPPLGTAVNSHNVIVISRSANRDNLDVTWRKVYDFRKSNLQAFCNCIAATDWSPVYQCSNVNDCLLIFYEKFYEVLRSQ